MPEFEDETDMGKVSEDEEKSAHKPNVAKSGGGVSDGQT